MIACAVFTPWWLWLTPIVHQKETRGPAMDPRGRVANRVGAQARLAGDAIQIVPPDKGGELVEATRVGLDERPVDPAVLDQQVRESIKEHQVGLGPHRQVQRGGHRRLGAPGIDDDDLGRVAVAHHPLPEDRMGDARRLTRPGRCSPTPRGPGRCKAGHRIRTPACRPRRPSPCTGAYCRRRERFPCRTWRATPSRAISSVAIWPVLRKAMAVVAVGRLD